MNHRHAFAFATRTTLALVLLGAPSLAQGKPGPDPAYIQPLEASRVADPKLVGGEAQLTFRLVSGVAAFVQVEVRSGAVLVRELWSGTLAGGAVQHLSWDGRDDEGERSPTGPYTLRLFGPGLATVQLPLDLVRLGVTEMEAQDSVEADDEFQMVYFKKGNQLAFYATPAIHEYVNVARPGQVSDLDLDDGNPRPVVTVHTDTAAPVLDGEVYETRAHNYPLAYVQGARPRLELTFGASATGPDGAPMGVGYPVPGCELRIACDGGAFVPGTDAVTPGGTALLDLDSLPSEITRHVRVLALRFEVRPTGASEWSDVPGTLSIPLYFYTLLGPPRFHSEGTGTQYAGPWVEVADHVSSWKATLELPASDQGQLTEVFVKGYFGQNGGIATPMEGILYNSYPNGATPHDDPGSPNYFYVNSLDHPIMPNQPIMGLAALLDGHANGRFVNCSDNMGATTTMLSMLGAENVRPLRLGNMRLRAIWPIGANGYTLDVWGAGPNHHRFAFHHIVTDDGAVTVSDTCLQVDEDTNPNQTPGTPGWNARRLWTGTGTEGGYMNLAAENEVSWILETLPGLG